jgi:hypothetical protein
MLKDKELEAKWVAALRSEKYEQGNGFLRGMHNTYCCLGVLCDVIDPNAWHIPEGSSFHNWGKDNESGYLSPEMQKEIGLADRDMWVLIGMNDSEDASFEQIADRIEGNTPSVK